MKKQERFSTAPRWLALNRRRAAVLGGAGLLVAAVLVLIAPAQSNDNGPEEPANRTPFKTAGAKPAAVAGGVTLGMSTAVTPAARLDTADRLYEDASLAAMCQNPEIPQDEKAACAGVAAKSDRELESMLRQASKGGNVAAKTYLLRRNADEASARLEGTAPLDENQRAESVAQLKASVAELRDMALASKDPHQLTQLSALYLRNAGVLEGAGREAAVLTIAAALGKGHDPAEFNDLYATYPPDEAARIRQMAEHLADRLKGTSSTTAEADNLATKYAVECHVDKNGVNPCMIGPY